MTNTELLEKVIANSGYKKQFLASKIGLSYQGLLNKVQNKQDFRAKEIMILCKLLRISSELKEAIFSSLEIRSNLQRIIITPYF